MVEVLPVQSDLYQTLQSGPDGQPGGILITSVGQQVSPGIWLGGYKALETESFLKKNKIKYILSLGHFKYIYKPDEYVHKVNMHSHMYITTVLFFKKILLFM